jgi:hypothetical protein
VVPSDDKRGDAHGRTGAADGESQVVAALQVEAVRVRVTRTTGVWSGIPLILGRSSYSADSPVQGDLQRTDGGAGSEPHYARGLCVSTSWRESDDLTRTRYSRGLRTDATLEALDRAPGLH